MKTAGSQAQKALVESLRTSMERAGLTQQALAKRLKRPQSYVSDMLGGRIAKIGVLEVCDWATACDTEEIIVFAMFVTRRSRGV